MSCTSCLSKNDIQMPDQVSVPCTTPYFHKDTLTPPSSSRSPPIEGGGPRHNRGCMDNVYTLNEIVQGRLREDKKTFSFFLDIQKAYDTVWHDGLWHKLWDMGVKGRMWRVIKKMYMSSRSVVLLEGEKSDLFNVDQGVAQGCSLSPILFSVFINDLLKEVEQAELGIQLSSGKTIGGNVVC